MNCYWGQWDIYLGVVWELGFIAAIHYLFIVRWVTKKEMHSLKNSGINCLQEGPKGKKCYFFSGLKNLGSNPPSPVIGNMIIRWHIHFSEPQFPHLQKRNNSSYLRQGLKRWNEVMNAQSQAYCQAWDNCAASHDPLQLFWAWHLSPKTSKLSCLYHPFSYQVWPFVTKEMSPAFRPMKEQERISKDSQSRMHICLCALLFFK